MEDGKVTWMRLLQYKYKNDLTLDCYAASVFAACICAVRRLRFGFHHPTMCALQICVLYCIVLYCNLTQIKLHTAALSRFRGTKLVHLGELCLFWLCAQRNSLLGTIKNCA